jgi:hypothetical protein
LTDIDISTYITAMDFGLFLQPFHHPSEDPTAALERDLDLIVRLDELGYAEAWVGEHHSTGWENIASPEVVIAAAAERTEQIRFGTGVVQAGLHHPLVALDRMILLDHLTRGRVSFGIGIGGGIPSDLEVFGLNPETAGRRMQESLEVMLRLLAGEGPVSAESDWFELHDAVLQLHPYTKPHLPFAVASADPRNVELMGRLGGKVLLGGIPERVEQVYDHLARGAEEAGREASRDQIMLSYVLHVDEDPKSPRPLSPRVPSGSSTSSRWVSMAGRSPKDHVKTGTGTMPTNISSGVPRRSSSESPRCRRCPAVSAGSSSCPGNGPASKPPVAVGSCSPPRSPPNSPDPPSRRGEMTAWAEIQVLDITWIMGA